VICDLGVNFVERQVLLAGYTVERVVHDYGIDLLLFTYNEHGEPDVGHLFVQVKATEKTQRVTGGRFIAFRVAQADLATWLRQPMPVLLVVYEAVSDQAWWVHLQATSVRQTRAKGASVTLRIPVTQLLNREAVLEWARMKNEVLARLRRVRSHD
jgi:hypothetical protein